MLAKQLSEKYSSASCVPGPVLSGSVQLDLEWGIHRKTDFLSARQDIGKDGMAEAIQSKSDADRRHHSSGNTSRKSESGVGSQQPTYHVVLGCSDQCIAQRLG